MRYVDKPLYDKVSILIPRKGSLNNIMFQEKPFWTVDTMFWSKIDEEKVFPRFLFYQLSLIDYTILNVGSAVPSLTVPVINEIDINLPPLPEQKAIAKVLSSLDDKIDLLHRQNLTLEQMAETLFRQWFVEKAKEDWGACVLPDEFDFLMGQSPKESSFNEDGLANICQKVGDLRNDIGTTSHGKTLEEIKERNSKVDIITREFLIDTIETIAVFLIRNFEIQKKRKTHEILEDTLDYWEAEEFNESWDDSFGGFTMGDYSYPASEILFNVDKQAYVNEYKTFIESEE